MFARLLNKTQLLFKLAFINIDVGNDDNESRYGRAHQDSARHTPHETKN